MTPTFTAAELETLLHRPVRRLLSASDRRAFQGSRVLVTGAGGSVGSELARQIAACAPAHLTLVDHSELHLWAIERELVGAGARRVIEPVLADAGRAGAMARLCRIARPDVVFHAAAYKHVAMLERDVCAAVSANVLATAAVVEAARAVQARFVLVSSDKAAAPRSIMGATKRLAEIVALSRAGDGFRPIVVRFGNVLGSSGSVLIVLREHIRRGESVPVTDPGATRYFMTAGEAVALMMKADRLATRPETYWLDMGAPVAIGDLVERLMMLEARAGFARVPVRVIGLGPGEKRREELTAQGWRLGKTAHQRIWVARQRPVRADRTAATLATLAAAVEEGDARTTLEVLADAVPEFDASRDAQAWAKRAGGSRGRRVALAKSA